MSKRLYVAYGSNLNIRQMAMRCPTAKLFGTGFIENFELQFKGQPYGAFATIGEKDGDCVPVAVWEIKPMDEKSLDIYEGYPTHYYKQEVPVNINGQEISAMVYIMNQKMDFGVPSQRYYDTVYEGYENCGLDTKILNEAVDETIKRHEKISEKQKQFSLYDNFNDEDEYLNEQDDTEESADKDIDMNDPFYSSDEMHL